MASYYSDGDVDTNLSGSPSLNQVIDSRYSRRQTMSGALRASALAFFGTSLLAACGDDDDTAPGSTPVVDAGTDAATTTGTYVTLTGSVSQGNLPLAGFTQVGGPEVELVKLSDSSAAFIAPAVSAPTELTFRLSGGPLGDTTKVTVSPAKLGFAAVAKNKNDIVTVPAGYAVTVLTRLGDPIASGVSAYANDGTDDSFDKRIGDHGDALSFFGLDAAANRADNSSTRGLLVQNHENLNVQYLHPNGPTNPVAGPRPAPEAMKEIEAHGLSVVELRDGGNRDWSYVQNSGFNRRITPNTPVVFNGPAAGSAFLRTKYSTNGTRGRGTINNCANGLSAWGTILTCEENWAFYFRRDDSGEGSDNAQRQDTELTGLRRYGVRSNVGNYAWSTAQPTQEVFRRWDARATAASATEDFRNEPNQFGWVVEIDPYDPSAAPRKRTALGRFAHEGAWLGRLVAGQPVVVYMGDDSRREYMYKFVSNANWSAADAQSSNRLAIGDKYLDAGTLYVARFNADGTGNWLPLVMGKVPDRAATGSDPKYVFTSQADILVNTRLAADAVGATPMDRPEWTAVNPVTGEVYLTLTNNNASNRPLNGTDAANPRHYVEPVGTGTTSGNPNGHIVRMREANDANGATSFAWDIYLFGADSADADANVNISGLGADNDFSSPDGLWFSRGNNPAGQVNPLLWIQTDDGAFTDRTNNQMLAALPGHVGDGAAKTITNRSASGETAQQSTRPGRDATTANLRRFLTGPRECEITGVDTTPDGRTLFVGIQHPGEDGTPAAPTSNWPQSQTGTASGRPRSGVVVITREAGGIVGL